MSDRILIPFMDGKCLALSLDSFRQALKQGTELIQQGQSKQQDDQRAIWLSVPDVARLCNISETFLYDEVRLRRIRSRKFGRGVRIHRDYVEHQTGDLISTSDNDE